MSGTPASELHDLVQRHKVVYEVHPALSVYTGKRQVVGYDVELRGTHGRGADLMASGCAACAEVWMDLRRIADAVLPRNIREAEYEMPAFDHSVHEDRSSGREDVQLTIEIRHREGYNRPLDEDEERSLREIVDRLHSLGVRAE